MDTSWVLTPRPRNRHSYFSLCVLALGGQSSGSTVEGGGGAEDSDAKQGGETDAFNPRVGGEDGLLPASPLGPVRLTYCSSCNTKLTSWSQELGPGEMAVDEAKSLPPGGSHAGGNIDSRQVHTCVMIIKVVKSITKS